MEKNTAKRLYLEILSACNQDCIFCVKGGKNKTEFFLSNEQVKVIMSKKIKEGYQDVVFTGGEPTLRPDLGNLVEFSKKIGYNSATIISNAVSFSDNEKVSEILKHASDDFSVYFSISLHSHVKKISEKITGSKNTFYKTISGIENLLNNGCRKISIYHLINIYNYRSLPAFVEYISFKFPMIKYITFSFIYPSGAALENMEIFPRLSNVQYYLTEAFRKCQQMGITYSLASCGSVPFCLLNGYENVLIKEQESDRPENMRIVSLNKDEGFTLATKDFHNKTKVKSEDCKECLYFNDCSGIWMVYAARYGVEELSPIFADGKKRNESAAIITGYQCNNNCQFCLNSKKRGLVNKTTDEIKKEIIALKTGGSDYLELTGGEPTIRPDIIDLIKFAKLLRFKNIALATNGRFFSYPEFAQTIIQAGLTDLVFSIQGHNAELHDALTGVRGSFAQLKQGVKNVKNLGLKRLSTSTIIVKQNYRHLPEIGKLILKLGFKNSEFIFVDPTYGAVKDNFLRFVPRISAVAPYIHRCLDLGRQKGASWPVLNFPSCYLANYLEYARELSEPESFQAKHSVRGSASLASEKAQRTKARVKPAKCRKCYFLNRCEGIWKEYIKHYGDSEFNPVKK